MKRTHFVFVIMSAMRMCRCAHFSVNRSPQTRCKAPLISRETLPSLSALFFLRAGTDMKNRFEKLVRANFRFGRM